MFSFCQFVLLFVTGIFLLICSFICVTCISLLFGSFICWHPPPDWLFYLCLWLVVLFVSLASFSWLGLLFVSLSSFFWLAHLSVSLMTFTDIFDHLTMKSSNLVQIANLMNQVIHFFCGLKKECGCFDNLRDGPSKQWSTQKCESVMIRLSFLKNQTEK